MSERTEAPTPQRLREAKQEGRVARSVELNSAAILLTGAFLLSAFGSSLSNAMQGLMSDAITVMPTAEVSIGWVRDWFVEEALRIIPPLVGMLLVLMLVGVSVTLAQTGLMWAQKKIGFDFKRVNPLQGLKRIFSAQGVVEMLKALLKLVLVSWVAYSFLRSRIEDLLVLNQMDLPSALSSYVELSLSLAFRVGTAYIILAVADYAYQRWEFMRSMRMSKQELKEEFKRTEGDPMLRGRIRQQQRRIAQTRMMANVPKANVIITNPTHYAIAIQYDGARMSAPKVLAKGAFEVAQKIVEIAKANNIPVIQNQPLARAMFREVEIDREIPQEFYVAVAEVLAYVFNLKKRGGQPIGMK